MSKPAFVVTLVIGPDCDTESLAMRLALEYFGARVYVHYVGRPNDLVEVLSGEDRASDTNYLILNFHGEEGKFCIPELDNSFYEVNEPKGRFFDDEHVRKYAVVEGLNVIGCGCTLGKDSLAKAFLKKGCKAYIAPDDYIDGNANLMFVLTFFYELISNRRSQEDAFQIARSIDSETKMYNKYTN
ncbi:hypothetical protein SAMN05421663_10551 [Terribacillus halophilus]|uniref:Delta-aminolevulinic acid dehydratase n=1 Tax=Terribacillus halophilus TaxID=361279 RepID=A0A1G6QEW9_9BACI|nr:delta-aminolevulinic acid dehydratase [Terribacillus halophilus]SDC90843.1 hypothetical protein SAMN05421663_10551 [Terribacillus halophilus]